MTRRIGFSLLAALALAIAVAVPALAAGVLNFRTHLANRNEVAATLPVTGAQGQAVLQLSADGQSLDYRVNVANIENVTMSHIHLAPAGANGPIVVWLYPSAPPAQLIPGRTDGVLMTGTITAADLRGPLAGRPLSALIDKMMAGETYVNVHTSAFPAGEVRGQIHH